MEIAFCKEVLMNLLAGAAETGMYQDDLPRWKAMLAKIPPYMVNEDGAIKEWTHPDLLDNYAHRHASHVYPLFPGMEVDRSHKLFPAFRRASELRVSAGLSSQSGWSLMHEAAIFARCGDGDLALECLRRFSQTCIGPNFFTYHNDWREMGATLGGRAIFQVDANLGWTAAVQEMLLFSDIGKVSVLPALPADWKQGEVKGLRCRGGIEISIRWNTAAGEATIELTADRDQDVDVSFPTAIRSLTQADLQFEGNTIRGLALKLGQRTTLTAALTAGEGFRS
jgi:alpha-L-fucosidase 2